MIRFSTKNWVIKFLFWLMFEKIEALLHSSKASKHFLLVDCLVFEEVETTLIIDVRALETGVNIGLNICEITLVISLFMDQIYIILTKTHSADFNKHIIYQLTNLLNTNTYTQMQTYHVS